MAAGQAATKVVLTGKAAVGKTAIVTRLVSNQFASGEGELGDAGGGFNKGPTIGASFVRESITLPTSIVHLDIWDTAGQERFQSLTHMYYRGAQAAVVVFSVDRQDGRASWAHARDLVGTLQRDVPDIHIVLVANKTDLPHEEWFDPDPKLTEQKRFAEENGLTFRQCSAKDGQGVRDIFVHIAATAPSQVAAEDQGVELVQQHPPSTGCCGPK